MDVFLAIRFDGGAVTEFFFNDVILRGIRGTLEITVLAMVFGILLGIALGVMRVSHNRLLAVFSGFYVWFVRGTPVLIQLLVVANGLPQMVGSRDFTLFLTPFRAAVLTFTVNEAAYMAEIVRAGIQAIEPGQMDAGKSLGMTNLQAMRRVVLPQALRVVIPPTGNEVIAMLKNTSIAFAIGFVELTNAARLIYAVNFKVMELLVVASIWYLLATTAFSVLQAELEARLAIVERERAIPLTTRVLRALGRGRER
jgi:polar amino acid transport system permease protein